MTDSHKSRYYITYEQWFIAVVDRTAEENGRKTMLPDSPGVVWYEYAVWVGGCPTCNRGGRREISPQSYRAAEKELKRLQAEEHAAELRADDDAR